MPEKKPDASEQEAQETTHGPSDEEIEKLKEEGIVE
jgi:hypothetical protein